MTEDRVAGWVLAHPLSPGDVDCATAVMLKILDGKCKMSPADKRQMSALYEDMISEFPQGRTLFADYKIGRAHV